MAGTVKEYVEFLETELKKAKKLPEDSPVEIYSDNGDLIKDGGDEEVYPEEIFETDWNGYSLAVKVVTDY